MCSYGSSQDKNLSKVQDPVCCHNINSKCLNLKVPNLLSTHYPEWDKRGPSRGEVHGLCGLRGFSFADAPWTVVLQLGFRTQQQCCFGRRAIPFHHIWKARSGAAFKIKLMALACCSIQLVNIYRGFCKASRGQTSTEGRPQHKCTCWYAADTTVVWLWPRSPTLVSFPWARLTLYGFTSFSNEVCRSLYTGEVKNQVLYWPLQGP